MSSLKVFSIIPARSGSKGIINKNITHLCGKALIAWSIEASLKSKYITRTIVSSDGETILQTAKEYGAEILKRPKEFAQDNSSTESVILHLLESFNDLALEYDYLILLQPTSPLRDAQDIDKAFETLLKNKATALISVYEEDNKILKAFTQNNSGYIQGIANNQYPFMPRQDLPPVYMSNGAIYIIKISEFLKTQKLLSGQTTFYKMPKAKSLDIDTQEDLNKAKEYLEQNNYERHK